MSTRVDRLITNVIRKISNNEEFSDDTGIDTELILYYMNEAQHRLQGLIIAAHNNVFVKTKTISVTNGDSTYDIPSDAFLENKIISIDYSINQGDTYSPLKLLNDNERNLGTNYTGFPHGYIPEEGVINLVPIPNQDGLIRIRYIRRIDELDTRRGIINTVTLNSTDNTITTLTLDTSGTPPIDSNNLDGDHDFICVVDTVGAVKMRNIRIDSLDTSTGAFTINSGFTYESGDTITVGDYVVGGKDTTTHLELGRSVERYLVRYTVLAMLHQDSSVDILEADALLRKMSTEITNSYASINEGEYRDAPLDNWWLN